MLTSEILHGAADYMDEHGWTQGVGESDTGEVCLVGALEKVLPRATPLGYDTFCEMVRYLAGEIRAVHPNVWLATSRGVVAWNDKHCRDKEEALYMLRLAAKSAENDGC